MAIQYRIDSNDIHDLQRRVCHHERKLIKLRSGQLNDVYYDVFKEIKNTEIKLARAKSELHRTERLFNRQIRA
jgi:hypothetical protein